MLSFLNRWFQATPKAIAPSPRPVTAWADSRQFAWRPVRDDGGVVIEGRCGATPWRLEWGPSQRHYVIGHELRLRAELGFGAELQLLILNRHLQEAMERAVFDRYVESVKTHIDDQTPPEMRWLVMFPKLSGTDLGALRDSHSAAGNASGWLKEWLELNLSKCLAGLSWAPEHPVVLMIGRGRLLLRTQCTEPTREQLESHVRLFETALREARRVHEQHAAARAPSTRPSLFAASQPALEN